MADAPFLPLSRRQAATLVRSLDGVTADAGGAALPRAPERVIAELTRLLDEERRGGLPGDADDGTGDARKRARRVGALGGLAGALGALPSEALHLVEEARVAVALAAQLPGGRDHRLVAADLLVLWGLVGDRAQAEAIAAEQGGSLLDALYALSAERVRDATPEKWNAVGTLRFLWRMRDVAAIRDKLPGGVLRNIPVIGAIPGAIEAHRDMRAFQRDAERHYDALASGGA